MVRWRDVTWDTRLRTDNGYLPQLFMNLHLKYKLSSINLRVEKKSGFQVSVASQFKSQRKRALQSEDGWSQSHLGHADIRDNQIEHYLALLNSQKL